MRSAVRVGGQALSSSDDGFRVLLIYEWKLLHWETASQELLLLERRLPLPGAAPQFTWTFKKRLLRFIDLKVQKHFHRGGHDTLRYAAASCQLSIADTSR